MANYDEANGFVHAGGPSRPMSMTAAGTIAEGDLLQDDGAGLVEVYTEEAGNRAVGVAMHSAVVTDTVLVETHPDAEFRVQTSGTYTSTTDDLTLCDVEGTTGIQEANEDAGVNNTLTILHQDPVPGSEDDGAANARIRVKIAKHVFSPGSGGFAHITDLTPPPGGTANDVLQDMPGDTSSVNCKAEIENNFADVAEKINEILERLEAAAINLDT